MIATDLRPREPPSKTHQGRAESLSALFRLPLRVAGYVLALLLAPWVCDADQWVTGLTPTLVQAGDAGGEYIYFITSQAIVNPAACGTSDGYTLRDPAITKDALAILLTAYATGNTFRAYVSSSVCDPGTGRPQVLLIAIG